MGLTPQVQQLLDEMSAAGMQDFADLSVLQARTFNAGFDAMQGDAAEIADVHDILVQGAAGLLPARVFHPAPGEKLPVVVYFHGGGWVIGNVDVADKPCRLLAAAGRCVVIAVGYRISPETKFPGPVEDCYAATKWVFEHLDEVGGSGWLAVAGDSAGGDLAAVTAIMARDRGTPKIDHQLLIYPVAAPSAGEPFDSYRRNGSGYMTTARSMHWFFEHYLMDESQSSDEYVAPLNTKDLSGLPPAFIATAEFDPLHDEDVALGEALEAAGVPVTIRHYDGVIHGFFWMPGRIDEGKQLAVDLGEFIRSATRSGN